MLPVILRALGGGQLQGLLQAAQQQGLDLNNLPPEAQQMLNAAGLQPDQLQQFAAGGANGANANAPVDLMQQIMAAKQQMVDIVQTIAKIAGIVAAVFFAITLAAVYTGHWIVALIMLAPPALLAYEIYALANRASIMLPDINGPDDLGNLTFQAFAQDTLLVQHAYTYFMGE